MGIEDQFQFVRSIQIVRLRAHRFFLLMLACIPDKNNDGKLVKTCNMTSMFSDEQNETLQVESHLCLERSRSAAA